MTTPSLLRGARLLLVPVALGLGLVSCRPTENPLEPAPGERATAAPGDAIETTVSGVEVTAASDAWDGSPDVLDHVTPLRITIHNDSGHPVRVHLRHMRLVDDDGTLHAALPLYLINGRAEVERLAYRPDPTFGYDRYYVAGPYAPYYPGIAVYQYGVPYDDYDYARYYTYWDTVPLPTQRMVDLSIPEGVVQDGGYVSGFVFFERVDPALSDGATFVLELVDADTGKPIGTADLRFDVAS